MSERTYGAAELAELLDGGRSAGLVRLAAGRPAADVLAAAERAGWRATRLDLRGAADKAAFMEHCARDLDLPGWFGRNWDALYDCLGDPDWAGPRRRLVLVTGWQDYANARPEEWATAGTVLADAAAALRDGPAPLAVLVEEEPVTDPGRPTPGTSGPDRPPAADRP